MSVILCIDPGTEASGVVELNYGRKLVHRADKAVPNSQVLNRIREHASARSLVVCEWVQSYGMSVGIEVFETCCWVGRFWETAEMAGASFHRVTRMEVKMHLCNHPRAKDPDIRQALIDRFGPGKEKAIGKKKAPGPLFEVTEHSWAALAVGVTWCELEERTKKAGPVEEEIPF